jgi:hypothetical protein
VRRGKADEARYGASRRGRARYGLAVKAKPGRAWYTRRKGQGMNLSVEAVQELRAIENRAGKLTPEQVVNAAADESSALHSCFTWDDSEAAAKWRLDEAREIIRSVRIETVIEERTIRSVAYVHDPGQDQNVAGYINTMKVRKPDVAAVIRQELNAIAALCERAIGIAQAKADVVPGVAEKIIGIKAQVVRLADGL